MSERDELKPCPFCGGEPGMVQQTKVNWAVMCHVCGAEGGWSNPSDAIALWNRRPTPPQAVPALTEPVAWMHVMDNTEGIPENKPWVRITQSPENPFGVPGEDYSETFPVTSTPLYAASQPSPEPKGPEHAHDWRFSLQDHLYKCDCGATRGDYPFGAASFKD